MLVWELEWWLDATGVEGWMICVNEGWSFHLEWCASRSRLPSLVCHYRSEAKLSTKPLTSFGKLSLPWSPCHTAEIVFSPVGRGEKHFNYGFWYGVQMWKLFWVSKCHLDYGSAELILLMVWHFSCFWCCTLSECWEGHEPPQGNENFPFLLPRLPSRMAELDHLNQKQIASF